VQIEKENTDGSGIGKGKDCEKVWKKGGDEKE
jgi:hypothetical protein